MGNCLDSSAKVDTAQSSHATSAACICCLCYNELFLPLPGSGVPKFSIRTDRSSAPSSRAIQSFSDKSNTSSEILSSPNLKALNFNELKNSTRNFHPDSFLGEGGFGYVFKGWIDEYNFSATKPGSGMAVAVKKLKSERFQGHKKWLTEVNYFGQLHHPNLVKLIGYCLEGENRLLVYQFMPKGSLENHLFKREPQPLSWEIRIKVATGAARGLCFLHEAKSPVIYRRLTAKSDVYSFGVVLLELLSGRRVVDRTKVDTQQILVDWAIPYLRDKRQLFRIMDTKLEGQYPQKGAYTVATLALKCLSTEAKFRPKMVEVLTTLEQLVNSKKTRFVI
ncbi:putative serine/threonine-protein kinase pbl3 [Quercus suber]|uniref:non-specific serine/threonine protein kinase n=1 Tax=Quercus suber TaxID=58331 RepID=A0AAW0JAU0_QUESU